ncbi:AraC family transcriptional regulator [Photobacterium sp. ZSDE20]|uniref:AraC family transcriptional regulator n=1 Tax=Photobacterium pectinilyticum TaxID=2906793 RepID=A0ABT1NC19_9GAMM|nr:AraC family transcriptional regulator [Photobacterium sp. ZSDE20]MCQ1060879.1 AraC family transcriptional regulator [Photobacterium sp. ZSDE20]MDD1828747.1 AraC family transcriptional regulator [Photobacterium sp. ZSDE20]
MSGTALLSNISGIHSKQPFFVLNSEHFHTHLAPDNPEVSHFYSFKAGSSQESTIAIPDGCIDIMFDCDAGSPIGQVCGTRLEASATKFKPGHRYFGFRFVPGVLPDFLALSAQDLIDHEVNLAEVMTDYDFLLDQVMDSGSFSQQVVGVSQFLKSKPQRETTRLSDQIIAKIRQHKGNIQVQELERLSGYTSRTLQRIFKNDIGLTPKGFSRAIRCQCAVYDINHNDELVFSELAADLGFSDQSHFLKEFKKLVKATPQEYLNRVKQKTYLERIQCH